MDDGIKNSWGSAWSGRQDLNRGASEPHVSREKGGGRLPPFWKQHSLLKRCILLGLYGFQVILTTI